MGSPEPNLISQVQPQPDCKYTRSTTPGLQIHVIGCRVAVPRSHWSAVPTPLFIYISQLLRDSFSVSQQPPIWEPPSHYSMRLQLWCRLETVKCVYRLRVTRLTWRCRASASPTPGPRWPCCSPRSPTSPTTGGHGEPHNSLHVLRIQNTALHPGRF